MSEKDSPKSKLDTLKMLNDKASACLKAGNQEQAFGFLQQALELDPRNIQLLNNMGIVCSNAGKIKKAINYFETALSIMPGFVDAIAGKAEVLFKEGEYDHAYQTIRPYIKDKETFPKFAICFGKFCHHLGKIEEGIDTLEKVADSPNLKELDKIPLLFSLGNLYDKHGDYEKAFAKFKQGNDSRKSTFDPDAFMKMVERFKRFFTKEMTSGLQRSDCNSQLPVFIVGMPRSGTSLVEKIIDSHPHGYGAGELMALPKIMDNLSKLLGSGLPYPQCLESAVTAKLSKISQIYLKYAGNISGGKASRVVDKMPSNYQYVSLISILFPNSRAIHTKRNPLDTCLSCYFIDFGEHNVPYSYDLKTLGTIYNGYRDLMKHWKSTLDVNMIEIDYERLIADPESGIRSIIDFCGLDWDDNCLSFHRSKGLTNTASFDQVRQPMYSTSVNRYKHYEKYLNDLKEILRDY